MNNGLLKSLRCFIHNRWQVCRSRFRDCSQAKTTFGESQRVSVNPRFRWGRVSPEQLLLVLVGRFRQDISRLSVDWLRELRYAACVIPGARAIEVVVMPISSLR